MKQVINNPSPVDTVDVSDVHPYRYYGFILDEGDSGYITTSDWKRDAYRPKFFYGMTESFFCSLAENSLEDCIKYILENGGKVYEFDNHKEFFNWAAQQEL